MTTSSSAADAKRYISLDELHTKSEDLAFQIDGADFHPTFVVALWRGAAYPALVVQETLQYLQGTKIDCVAVRTESRDSVTGLPLPEILVHAIGHILSKVQAGDRVALIDDCWDSGRSSAAFWKTLEDELGDRMPRERKVAVLFDKPLKHKTEAKPDFFVESSNDWLVFPHELEGLKEAEVKEHRPRVWERMEKKKHV